MKKIFLMAVAAFALASCGGNQSTQTTETEEAAVEQPSVAKYAPVAKDGKVIELEDASALTPGVKVEQLTVVDFNAVWCGPCRQLTPVLEELAAKYQGKVTFISVDVDKLGNLFEAYQMGESIPAVLFLKPDGTYFKKIGTGELLPAENFEKIINDNL
ncbi:MAG: hypothetical protein K1W01_10320 [Muribaculaceae bacterium]